MPVIKKEFLQIQCSPKSIGTENGILKAVS